MTTNTHPIADDRILSKIKKCLALSASDNEGEAANALRQAQALMAKYNVTAEGLTRADVGSARAKSTACTKPAAWEIKLCWLLCEAFGCKPLIQRGWFNKRTNSNGALAEFIYIGLTHQAQTASYAHDVLRRQVLKARAKFLAEWVAENELGAPDLKAKIAAGDAFTRGYVENVKSKVQAITLEPAHQAAVDQVYAEQTTGPAKGKVTQRGFDAGAYFAGLEAGKDAQLHRPMGPATERKQIA